MLGCGWGVKAVAGPQLRLRIADSGVDSCVSPDINDLGRRPVNRDGNAWVRPQFDPHFSPCDERWVPVLDDKPAASILVDNGFSGFAAKADRRGPV